MLLHFGLSNSLCTRVSWAIVNHTPIGKYCLKFFPMEDFSCLYGLYSIETRQHILHEYKRFNKYWKILLLTLHYSSNLILVLFLLFQASLICNIFSIIFFSIFSLCLLSFSFLFLLFFFSLFLHVVSVYIYVVMK